MNIAARQVSAVLVTLSVLCSPFAPVLTATAFANNDEDAHVEAVETPHNTGVISGVVFNDTDQNTEYDGNEPLLEGWKVKLHKGTAEIGYDNDVISTDYTDATGNYFFDGLEEGTYFVEEMTEDGWAQTTADAKVTLTGNHNDKTLNFSNVKDEEDTAGGNGGNGGGGTTPPVYVPQTGGLVVKKIVVGGSATAEQFSFSFNGVASSSFNVGGENAYFTMATGTYNIAETATSTYTAAYDNCIGIVVSANATSTCTITNTFIAPIITPPVTTGGSGNTTPVTTSGGSGGGGGYVISGPQSIGYVSNGSGNGLVLGASTDEPSCSTPLLTTYMREHQSNDKGEVTKLQIFLNKEVGSALPVTGYFGPLTTKAVNTFQYKYKVEVLEPWIAFGLEDHIPTGYVYKTTRHKINQIACANLQQPAPQLP